ncbi:MAG: hypothetical protein SGPRY_004385, partial [Prymnesium sp.]
GFLSSLVTCAARLGESISYLRDASREVPDPSRWGLLVLSDSEAFPSLVAQLPALRERVITTEVRTDIP